MRLTSSTPSICSTSSPMVVGKGRWLLFEIRNSAPTTSSTAALTDLLADVVMMANPVTRAMPTMTADAVAADRLGCLAELSIARRPTVPKTCGSGAPIVRVTGFANNGMKMMAPTKAPKVPSPTNANPPLSPLLAPLMSAHAASTRRIAPMIPRRRSDEVGIVASSRSAATGGILLARRAGNHAARTVSPVPRRSPMMKVLGESTRGVSPISMPSAPKNAVSSIVMTIPNRHPMTEATNPTIADSVMTDRMI